MTSRSTTKNSKKDLSYIIPVEQQKTQTNQCYFDRQTKFKDSLFYDISAWSFDLAFNVVFQLVSRSRCKKPTSLKVGTVNAKSDIGYLIEWTDQKLLNQLLSKA
jgi:hypothetical protein